MISDKDLVISFVLEMELLSFPKITAKSEDAIRGILDSFFIIDLKQEIKEIAITFRRRLKLKLPDAIIVATAYFYQPPYYRPIGLFKG